MEELKKILKLIEFPDELDFDLKNHEFIDEEPGGIELFKEKEINNHAYLYSYQYRKKIKDEHWICIDIFFHAKKTIEVISLLQPFHNQKIESFEEFEKLQNGRFDKYDISPKLRIDFMKIDGNLVLQIVNFV